MLLNLFEFFHIENNDGHIEIFSSSILISWFEWKKIGPNFLHRLSLSLLKQRANDLFHS